jgi:hypothetical protein
LTIAAVTTAIYVEYQLFLLTFRSRAGRERSANILLTFDSGHECCFFCCNRNYEVLKKISADYVVQLAQCRYKHWATYLASELRSARVMARGTAPHV